MEALDLKSIDESLGLHVEKRGVLVSFCGKGKKFEGKKEAVEVVDAINGCENLECLNLEGNTLGVEAALEIGTALKNKPKMKEVLCKDLFTGRMKTEIPVALQHLSCGMMSAGARLTVVDFSDNALGPNGMKGLVDFLKSPSCYTLQELKLNNCGLGVTGCKMLADALMQCFKNGSTVGEPLRLRTFIAGRNRLENEGTKALAEVFKVLTTLEEVAIPQNGIYHVGIQALSDAFKENPNLRIVNLNDNTVTAKGADYLRTAFFCLPKLQEINLGDCLLRTKGGLSLADAIIEMANLEVVDLSFNEIRVDGGIAIAEAMVNKCNLQTINLNGNIFGTEGREQINEILNRLDRQKCLVELVEDESDDEEEEDGEDSGSGEETEDYDGEEDEDVGEEEIDEDIEYVSSSVPVDNSFRANLSADISRVSVGDDLEHPENSAEAFVNAQHPSESMFSGINDSNKTNAIREYLKTIPQEQYLAYLVFTILKCAELSEKSTEALNVSEELFMDVFQYAQKNNSLQSVRNFFLVQLGLLKSEDKAFKPKYNVQGCRYALRSVLQKDIIPEDEKIIYQFLLDDKNKTAPISLAHP